MKKTILLTLLPLLLASCGGGNNTFFDKTFTYKNDVYYNLELETTFKKTYRQVIEEQIRENNIAWEDSGASSNYGYTVVNFEKHANYDEMIDSMRTMSINAFNEAYRGGLTIQVGSLANKDCTITIGNEKKTFKLKTYGGNAEDALYQQIVDGETVVGELNVPSLPGCSVNNGFFDCIEFTFNSVRSRTKFQVMFKSEVKLGDKFYAGMEWEVWAKINN